MQLTVRHLKWQSLSRNLNPSRNPNLSLSRNPSQSPNRNPNRNRNLSPNRNPSPSLNRNPSRNRNLSPNPNRNRKFRIIPAPGILPVILPVTAEMGPEKILRQKRLTSLSPAVRDNCRSRGAYGSLGSSRSRYADQSASADQYACGSDR